jgi:hypothetical protein
VDCTQTVGSIELSLYCRILTVEQYVQRIVNRTAFHALGLWKEIRHVTSNKLLPFIGLQPEKLKKIAVQVKHLFDCSKSRFLHQKNINYKTHLLKDVREKRVVQFEIE